MDEHFPVNKTTYGNVSYSRANTIKFREQTDFVSSHLDGTRLNRLPNKVSRISATNAPGLNGNSKALFLTPAKNKRG
jgi:hypothetical protein